MNSPEIYLYQPVKSSDPKLNVWMAFPGPESFALSSLGFMWLYKELDASDEIDVEMISANTTSTKFHPENVDAIGFSFSFENDFMEIFSILEKYNIPLRAKYRDESFPLIFAGGPVVSANPAPFEEFFDFFVIGDGEEVNKNILTKYLTQKAEGKDKFLADIADLEGIFVPNKTSRVKKSTRKIDKVLYTPILSENAFFPNTFIVEIARGCYNRCGFCLASYLNLPFRATPYEEIIKAIDFGLTKTNKIALLGAQLSAHPRFKDICNHIYSKIKAGNNIEMSVSSLRVDSITPEILEVLKACGQKHITLAIEAGSERLRKVINKNLTNDQIFKAIEISNNAGLKGVKFYGMLGLPTETDADIDEFIALMKQIKQEYKGFEIQVGFSTFVPKAQTPFQWIGREETKSLEKKGKYIQKELHKLGVTAAVSSAKWDYWQAVLSRGNSKLADFLERVYLNGGKLGAYNKAARELNLNTDFYAYTNWDINCKLPWDYIELTPGKEFLQKEFIRLINPEKNSPE